MIRRISRTELGVITVFFRCSVFLGLILLPGSLSAQIDFDRPDVIQTSFARQMAEERGGSKSYVTPASHNSYGCQSCSSGGYSAGYSYGHTSGAELWSDCGSCSTCDSCCGAVDYCCPGSSRLGLTVSGIIDIPLDGVFHTGDDASVLASDLGIPAGVWPGGTPFDLLFEEQGFEDVYNTFGGVQANLDWQLDCNTSFFFGYRFVQGQADLVNVGTAVANPLAVPTTYDITAQFSEYRESQLQAGFLSSRCLYGSLNFLWGGRMGIGFVDEITGTVNIDGLTTLDEVPFYDDTTNFAFGFNFGLEMNLGCHIKAHALTGAEYRSSLNQDDSVLGTLGLDELNNGSGFASLPVYIGITYRR